MTHIKKIAIASIILLSSSVIASAATGVTVTTGDKTTVTASLEVKNAPKLVSKTSNSITLEWEKVEAAANYIVKYSKNSVATSDLPNPQYDNETDPITSTGTTIEKLEPDTNYYFSVVAVDKDNNESDTYSDELKVKTEIGDAAVTDTTSTGATTSTTGSLSLVSASAQDSKTVTLEFSNPLSAEPVTLKITKVSDNSDVPVDNVVSDPTSPAKVIATVATVLDPQSSYSVTVIKATDTSGNNIKQGVDGVKEFLTSDLNAAPTGGVNVTSGPTSVTTDGAGGVNINGASGGVAINPANAPELPATGTKENLIVLAALILSFGIVYIYRRKTAK